MPTTHCTNMYDASSGGAVYHTDFEAGGYDMHSGVASASAGGGAIDDLGGDDFDYAMDCGDFIF